MRPIVCLVVRVFVCSRAHVFVSSCWLFACVLNRMLECVCALVRLFVWLFVCVYSCVVVSLFVCVCLCFDLCVFVCSLCVAV